MHTTKGEEVSIGRDNLLADDGAHCIQREQKCITTLGMQYNRLISSIVCGLEGVLVAKRISGCKAEGCL